MQLKTSLLQTSINKAIWNSIQPDFVNHDKDIILFLHGFAGCANDWSNFFQKLIANNYLPIALDILGHGESSSPDNIDLYSQESMVTQLNDIIKALTVKKIIIVGYSLGGRLALSYAVKHSDRLKGMILESATPGIEEESLRKERVINDKKIAERILESDLADFFNYWYNIPLFASLKKLPPEKLTGLISKRMKNSKIGLSNIMTGFSQGNMSPLWSNLPEIKIPTLLITGNLDEKFTNINTKMKERMLNSNHIIIDNAGHIPHLENFSLFEDYLLNFLRTL